METSASRDGDVGLARRLGTVSLTLYGLGNILGAGIYVLVGEVAGSAGLWAPLSFLLAGAVAALSACSYAEMAARYPVSAGEAVWVQEGFQVRAVSIATGLLIAAAGLTSAATLARGFAGYLGTVVVLPEAVGIVALVLVLGTLAAWGVSESVRAAGLLTLIEAAGLVGVVVVVANALAVDAVTVPETLPPIDQASVLGIFAGAYLAFFAFIGFEDMVNVAEEVREPGPMMTRSILAALVIATVLYGLVVTACVIVVPPAELAASPAPLADVYARAGGVGTVAIALVGMVAVVNGGLVQLIMAARVFYGMARRGWVPGRLAQVNRRTRTPLLATIVATGIVLVLALGVELGGLARATSFIVLAVFILVNVALLLIKRRGLPAPAGGLDVPPWLPVVGASSAVLLLAAALIAAAA